MYRFMAINPCRTTISPYNGTPVGFTPMYGNKLVKSYQIQAGGTVFCQGVPFCGEKTHVTKTNESFGDTDY